MNFLVAMFLCEKTSSKQKLMHDSSEFIICVGWKTLQMLPSILKTYSCITTVQYSS